MHYTTRLILLAALCGLTAQAQIIKSNVFTREDLSTAPNKAAARALIGVKEWTTNSTPLVTGNHSTAAALDVDDTSGDAGLRLQYGTADYILKLYGTNLTLVSAADGSTPYYVAAPMDSAMLTYKSMTNLFVMKTNDIGLVSLATFEHPPDTNKFAPLLSIVKNSRVRLHSWDQDGDAAAVLVSGDDIDVGSVAASSVIATNLTAVVGTIAEMEAWANANTKTLVVNDANRGGTFIATTGLPVDNGIVFTNAMGGVFRRQYIGPLDVRWFGAIADDSTDDSGAITNAIIAAAAANGTVNIPEGTFTMSSPARFTSAIKNKRVTIQGAGKGTTVLDFSGVTLNGPVLSFTGGFNAVALPAPTTLTNGQETITFASAHGLAKADKVRILSTDVWNSADAGAVAGEFFKVVRVVSDTEVEIDHPLYDDYTVANCTLKLMEPASVTLRDFTVQSYDGSSLTIGSEAVSIYYGADCKIAGVEVLGAPRIAVELNHVYGVTVSDSSTLQGNEGPQTSQYGLSTDQCQDVFVRNCVLLAGRHAAKIGGNGMPSRALFYDNCRMASWYNSLSAHAFDTHGQSEYIKVSHCIIDGGMHYGGNKSEYVNNVIRVRPADGIPGWLGISPRALNGFDFRFENNTVEVLPGSPTSKQHAFSLYLSTVADTAASDGVFIIRNNTFIGGENSYPGVNVDFTTNAIPTFTFIIDGNTFQSTAASPVELLELDSAGNTFHGLLGKTIIRHNVFKNGYVSLSPVFQDLVFDGNSIDAGTTADYCLYIHGGAYPTNMVDGISMQIVNNDFRGSSFSQLRIYDTGWNGTSKQRLTIAGNTFLGPPTSTTLTASIRVTFVAGSVWNGFIADNRLFNTEGGSTTQLLRLDGYYGLLVGNNYRSDGLRVARTVGQTVAPGADGTVYNTSEATVNGNVYGLNGARLYDSYTGRQWTYYANNSVTPSTNRWNQTYPALVLPNATAPTLNADQSVIYSADYKTKATPHIVGENGIALPIALNSMSSVTAQRTSLAGATKIVDESGGAIGNFDTGWTVGASWTTNSSAVVNATGVTNSLSHTSVTALVGPPRFVTMTLVSGGAWTVDADASLTVTIGGSLMRTFVNGDAPSGTMTISGMVDGTTDEVVFTVYAPDAKTVSGSFDNFKIEVLAAADYLHRHTYHAAALVKASSATAPAPYFEFSAAGTHAANGNAKDKVIALVNTTVTSAPAILATIPSTDNNGSWRLKGKVYAAYGSGGTDYDNFMLELDYVDGSGTYTTSLHSTDLTGDVFAWNAAGYFLIGANADTADGDVTINTSSVEFKP